MPRVHTIGSGAVPAKPFWNQNSDKEITAQAGVDGPIPPPLVGLQRLESTGRDSRTGAFGGRQPPCVLGRVQLLDRPLLITPHPLPGPLAVSPA